MATWEFQLISRIVRCNVLQEALQWGITDDDFLSNEGKSLFRAVLGYHSLPETRGSVPGVNALHSFFPHIQLADDQSMTTEALCVETRRQRLRIEMRENMNRVLDLVDLDPIAAATQLGTAVRDIINTGFSKNSDTHFHMSWQRAVERARLVAQGYDFSVARWGWAPLQNATMGLQDDDYIVLYGRPKAKKSWVLAKAGMDLYDQEKRLLIYTKEMTPDNIFRRIGCLLSGVDYGRFQKGTMLEHEWMAVEGTRRMLEIRAKQQTFVCLNGQHAPKGGDTVEWLDSKVDQYDPEIILVDGMYLMSDSRGNKKLNERVRSISNDLRNLVLARKRPVIATIQANREAAKNTDANLDEIGFSDAIGQDCTLAMRVINEDKSGRPTVAVIVGGARECALSGFRIWGKPATDFGDFMVGGQELTAKEVEQARTDDVEEDKKKKDQKNGHSPQKTENQALIQTMRLVDKTV